MRKEQACPFSLRAELIGIWNSVRRGTPPLPERLQGAVDNLRSTRGGVKDHPAYSTWEYQKGVDRKGRPDLVHRRFGPMTDSLLRNVAIQKTPEGRRVAKAQLRQWLLIKEVTLNLKEGGEIYAFIPKIIEIKDGVALMKLRKEGDRFLAQSRLLPPDFDQEKASLLFEKFKEKGLKIKNLAEDEPSLIFWIAKGEKENFIDLKNELPQILTELSRPVLPQREEVLQERVLFVASNFLERPHIIAKVIEQGKGSKEELSLNQPEISVTQESSLHNLQRSRENVQPRIIEEKVVENVSVKEEQAFMEKERPLFLSSLGEQISLNIEQQEVAVEIGVHLTTREKAVPEVSTYVHPRGVNREEVRNSVAVDQSSEELLPKESVEKELAEGEEVVVFDQQRLTEEIQIGRVEKNEKVQEEIVFEKLSGQKHKSREEKRNWADLSFESELVAVERERVVVFEAAEPAPETELLTSVTAPFAFIRKEPILLPAEETAPTILIVPSLWQPEQTVHIEEETSRSVMPKTPPRYYRTAETKTREERVVLSKAKIWIPKIAHPDFPLSFFSSRGREGRHPFANLSNNLATEKFFNHILELRRINPSWIELLSPKEISLIVSLARDNFGINYPNSSATMADLTLFWLAAMNLFTQKPSLYKLKLDLLPLTVKVRDGKILVARKVIPEEILGREDLLVQERQFSSRPFLFLAT